MIVTKTGEALTDLMKRKSTWQSGLSQTLSAVARKKSLKGPKVKEYVEPMPLTIGGKELRRRGK